MKRTNQFDVRPRSEKERKVFVRWLDASASLWNETHYARRRAFLTDDKSVWDADTGSFQGKYKGTLSSSVAQQIIRKNSMAWRSFLSSNEKIEDALAEGDVLVNRYNGEDGLSGDEGAFVLCSCWLIDALALSGRVDEAHERFEALLEYVSPLGLVAEEVDMDSGAHLGNFPQGFSQIGIINSALYVGYAHEENSPGPPPMGVRLGDPILPDQV